MIASTTLDSGHRIEIMPHDGGAVKFVLIDPLSKEIGFSIEGVDDFSRAIATVAIAARARRPA